MNVHEFKNIFWDYTRKISENTHILISSFCEEYKLTALQVRILVAIKQHSGATIGSLAETMQVAGTNMSTMCKKLEQKGLIQRTRDPEDERVVKVELTKEGEQIVKHIDQTFTKKISQYIHKEDPEVAQQIITGLKKMNELVEKIIHDQGGH